MSVTVEALTGSKLDSETIAALAALRIEVFREWPYLYDGTEASEREYLEHHTKAKHAIVVVAKEADAVVGASTGMPLAEEHSEFIAPFPKLGYNPEKFFYCAESVLRKSYRGQGLGHRFFDEREDHARKLGFRYSTFCGVIRPSDHPARPADYRPLDAFWTKRGYALVPGLVTEFPWKDLGDGGETRKPMQFWIREL